MELEAGQEVGPEEVLEEGLEEGLEEVGEEEVLHDLAVLEDDDDESVRQRRLGGAGQEVAG